MRGEWPEVEGAELSVEACVDDANVLLSDSASTLAALAVAVVVVGWRSADAKSVQDGSAGQGHIQSGRSGWTEAAGKALPSPVDGQEVHRSPKDVKPRPDTPVERVYEVEVEGGADAGCDG